MTSAVIEHFGGWEHYKVFLSKREKILRKYNFECVICPMDELQQYTLYKRGLDIHHRDGNPQNNHENNLVPVCSECHHKIHPDREFIRWCGLRVHL